MDDVIERAVLRVIDSMHENLGEQITIDDMARTAMFSKFHFSRVFQRVTGLSPGRYSLGGAAARGQETARLDLAERHEHQPPGGLLQRRDVQLPLRAQRWPATQQVPPAHEHHDADPHGARTSRGRPGGVHARRDHLSTGRSADLRRPVPRPDPGRPPSRLHGAQPSRPVRHRERSRGSVAPDRTVDGPGSARTPSTTRPAATRRCASPVTGRSRSAGTASRSAPTSSSSRCGRRPAGAAGTARPAGARGRPLSRERSAGGDRITARGRSWQGQAGCTVIGSPPRIRSDSIASGTAGGRAGRSAADRGRPWRGRRWPPSSPGGCPRRTGDRRRTGCRRTWAGRRAPVRVEPLRVEPVRVRPRSPDAGATCTGRSSRPHRPARR